jgi:hypothetical protein
VASADLTALVPKLIPDTPCPEVGVVEVNLRAGPEKLDTGISGDAALK